MDLLRTLASRLALWILLLLPALARADFFSPGDLARPHAQYSGLKNCTLCHVSGQQLSQETCLNCHKELQPEVKAGRGFHGRIPAAERECQTCHKEHQGADFQLVDWGPGGKNSFEHQKTGWALLGKHAGLGCEKCHTPRLITDAAIKELMRKQPEHKTYLGLPTACNACHFDEHRGQESRECQTCHSEKGWKPAPKFDHGKTDYALTGKHRQVACDKCHQKQEDTQTPADAFPAPVNKSFEVFKPVAHQSCTDCHRDPHSGRFGEKCESCHTTDGWKIIHDLSKERAFHQKTRFPLEGAHRTVECKACHGPWPGLQPREKLKGLAFAKCTDCHVDSHEGQLGKAPDCTQCHSVETFKPARFDLAEHQKTKYPLEAAHRAVACLACHPNDERLMERVPEPVIRRLELQRRPLRFCLARFAPEGPTSDCRTCHKDVHEGQFAARVRQEGCTACHQLSAWSELKFQHDRDSRFALTGKHAEVACASCHTAAPGSAVVRYKPLDQACASCHADVHAGQFAPAPGQRSDPLGGRPADCARCHTTAAWKKVSFEHQPPFTTFVLDGKHQKVACEKCHPRAEAGPAVVAVRYKGVPRTCAGCHQDPHKGEFKGFEP